MKNNKEKTEYVFKHIQPLNEYNGYKNFDKFNESKKELSVADKNKEKIALKTLKLSDAGANLLGGMTKDEAISFLKKIGYTEKEIEKLSNSKVNESKKETATDFIYNNCFEAGADIDRIKELITYLKLDVMEGSVYAKELAEADGIEYKGFSKSLEELSDLFNNDLTCDTIYYNEFDGNYYLNEISEEEDDIYDIIDIDVKKHLTKYPDIYKSL